MMSLTKICLHMYPFIRFLIIILSGYFFGVKGFLFSILLYHAYLFVMEKVFKLVPYSAQDRMFILSSKEDRFNLMGVLILEDDYDVEKMKESIINRGIKQYKKLRCIQEIKHFEFWWKELPLSECLGRLNPFETRLNFKKFNTIQDIIEYSYEELDILLKLDKELPYKFILIKNEGGNIKNMLIFKVDHNLADGLGFIGLITALGENYSLNLFPRSMKKKAPSLFQHCLSLLQFPYYLIFPFIEHFFILYSGDTPFKTEKKKTGKPKICVSKQYKFDEYSKINKKLGITFNDMMMAAFSAAIKLYCKENYKVIPKKVITINPISNRGLPSDPKKLQITNDSSGIGCTLKLVDDPIKECGEISKEFAFKLRNLYLRKIVKFASDMCNIIAPYFLSKLMYNFAYRHCDILFSNVALPKEALIYGKTRVKEIYSLLTPGNTKALVAIYSYNGYFSWTICVDRCLDLSPDLLMKYVDDQMEYFKSKC